MGGFPALLPPAQPQENTATMGKDKIRFGFFSFLLFISLIVKGSLNLQDNSEQYVQHTLDPWNEWR